jgi:hypothetical protein
VCLTGETQKRSKVTEVQNAQRAAVKKRKSDAQKETRPDGEWCNGELRGIALMASLLQLVCVGLEGVCVPARVVIGRCVLIRCVDRLSSDVADHGRTRLALS